MKKPLNYLLAGTALLLLACAPQPSDQGATDGPARAVTAADSATFSAHLLKLTNEYRRQNGLSTLKPDSDLVRMGQMHSVNMARTNQMSHNTSVRGEETPIDRMKKVGIYGNAFSENVAKNFVYGFNQQLVLKNDEDGNCSLVFASNKEPVPLNTPESLARAFHTQWINSPAHRKNILTPGFTHMGGGIAPAYRGDFCGEVFATQTFQTRK